jgi:hypothetical protein
MEQLQRFARVARSESIVQLGLELEVVLLVISAKEVIQHQFQIHYVIQVSTVSMEPL